jgi:hypothetical protein
MSEINKYSIKFNKFLVLLFGLSAIFLFTIGTIIDNTYIIYMGFIPLIFEWYCAKLFYYKYEEN